MFKYCCYLFFVFEIILGFAHFIWPEYRWGQGRASYFNFNNSLTLASWFAGMQLIGVAILALIGFHREKRERNQQYWGTALVWLSWVIIALILSLAEITRFHYRFKMLGYPNPGMYELFIIVALKIIFLTLLGWFLIFKLRQIPGSLKYAKGWLFAWGLELYLINLTRSNPHMFKNWAAEFNFLIGLSYLFGCTFLLLALGGYVFRSRKSASESELSLIEKPNLSFPAGSKLKWILVGVGGTAFTAIFLQIILFRMLIIFGDYLTGVSVISIALLGLTLGGLIGWRTAHKAPLSTMITASLLTPVSIFLVFGTIVSLLTWPFLASILLMFPFVCCGVVITIALSRTKSHFVYCADLIGAAVGAFLVGISLTGLREEGSLIFLSAFSFLTCGCILFSLPGSQLRKRLVNLVTAGFLGFLFIGFLNQQNDWINIVRARVQMIYDKPEVLFSRSSFVGRYDVIRRGPASGTLKALENGRVIDTIRKMPADNYQIDPRLPHTLMENPEIFIIGLSGDGIVKTAKTIGEKVSGVELNPVIVSLQSNELAKYNGNSYRDIEVAVMDGRSYLEQDQGNYDMITLLNTHAARGRGANRSPVPEYLHTRQAMALYLQHLTERGIIVVEEPVTRPRMEVPVWKLVLTMRQALIDQGSARPGRHFFIFQWRTRINNFIQIVMKKNPFSPEEVGKLKKWLNDVDDIKKIERNAGGIMGPVRTVKTTILHSPDQPSNTNYSRILRGEMNDNFFEARNLYVTSDNRPFHFDVDPAHSEIKGVYIRTLIMVLLLIPFLWSFLAPYRSRLKSSLPYVFIVALTGLGFLLIEVVLIQRYEIFLGSPTVTFAVILGTLLVFSGLGSLGSGRFGQRGVYYSLGAILLLLMVHQWWIPSLFSAGAFLPLSLKICVSVASLAPLAFFMGIPFPYILRTGKTQFTESAAGVLFSVNASASALAVPLAMNISTSYGLNATFQTGILVYLMVGFLLLSIPKPKIRIAANVAAISFGALLLLWPLGCNQSVVLMADTPDQYRVYGISYGQSKFAEDKILRGGSSSDKMSFKWLFWLIKGHGRTILVDTGFDDPDRAKQWGINDYVQPAERLRQFGISPAEVSDIILTHAHWDHLGSLASYKNARIWIQESEYQHARQTFNSGKSEAKGMLWKDWQNLAAAKNEDRLVLVQGEHILFPGITMTLGGAHTPGSQNVTVETLDGRVIISGDNTYMYQNNRRHKAVGLAVDHRANLAEIKKMHRNAASPFYILPGHDPRVMRWFPRVSEGVVQITSIPAQ